MPDFTCKGNWTAIKDKSKHGYYYHCERCGDNKPFAYKEILTCSCDSKDIVIPMDIVIPIPSCKKISSGSCKSCAVPCCKEGD